MEDAGITRQGEEHPLEVKDIDLFNGLDGRTLSGLTACMKEISVAQGQRVFSRGESGDEMFIVRRGAIRILLPLEGGKQHHLATIGRGDFFGELSFLHSGSHSADTEAKVATDLYVLSRSQFNMHLQSDAPGSTQIFARLALVIADKLRQTDAELRALEVR